MRIVSQWTKHRNTFFVVIHPQNVGKMIPQNFTHDALLRFNKMRQKHNHLRRNGPPPGRNIIKRLWTRHDRLGNHLVWVNFLQLPWLWPLPTTSRYRENSYIFANGLTTHPTWMTNRFLDSEKRWKRDYNRQEYCKKKGKTIGQIINGSNVQFNATSYKKVAKQEWNPLDQRKIPWNIRRQVGICES